MADLDTAAADYPLRSVPSFSFVSFSSASKTPCGPLRGPHGHDAATYTNGAVRCGDVFAREESSVRRLDEFGGLKRLLGKSFDGTD